MATKLYAGFGRESINPDFEVSLSGYGDNYKRPGLGRENTIYITCLAFKNDDGKTLLVYTMDGLMANEPVAEALRDAIKNKIQQKDGSSLVGNMAAQGTTPRRLTDLIGSLCDLTSGSGDKGTPIILVQGYFDNYTM